MQVAWVWRRPKISEPDLEKVDLERQSKELGLLTLSAKPLELGESERLSSILEQKWLKVLAWLPVLGGRASLGTPVQQLKGHGCWAGLAEEGTRPMIWQRYLKKIEYETQL